MVWLDRLEEAKKRIRLQPNIYNTERNLVPSQTTTDNEKQNAPRVGTDKRGQKGPASQRGGRDPTAKTAKTTEAEQLGLVATWSIEFGYISLHDPTTGEWHDLRTEEAPDWAKREAFKRKELYRGGNRKAYRLTAREMEEIWEAERTEMWEHLDESSARPDDDKRDDLLYEDDLEREDQC